VCHIHARTCYQPRHAGGHRRGVDLVEAESYQPRHARPIPDLVVSDGSIAHDRRDVPLPLGYDVRGMW
jgi:hypothetical protein